MAKTNTAPSPSPAKAKSQGSAPAKRQTKKARLVDLLSRDAPVCLDKLSSALGWQRHTVSAAMTRLKQQGHAIVSVKEAGKQRMYAIVEAEPPKLVLKSTKEVA